MADFSRTLSPTGGDDTAALQAFVNSCVGNYEAQLTTGGWHISAPITIPGTLKLRGVDQNLTSIVCDNPAVDGFVYNSNDQFYLSNMHMYYSGANPTGALIKAAPANGGQNNGSTIKDMLLNNCGYGIFGNRMNGYVIDNVDVDALQSGIYTIQPGDSTITNCSINAAGGAGAGVWHVGYAGLRIVNNRITGGSYGVYSQDPNDIDLFIDGNSFEGYTTAGVRIGASTTGAFGFLNVRGNDFATITPGCICVALDAPLGVMTQRSAIVSNNLMLVGQSSIGVSVGGFRDVLIDGNVMQSATDGPVIGNIGINLAPQAAYTTIGVNHYVNLQTNISGINSTTKCVAYA